MGIETSPAIEIGHRRLLPHVVSAASYIKPYAAHTSVNLIFQISQKVKGSAMTSGTMIPVAANDVALSIHAVVLTAFTLFQIAIYDHRGQKVSKTSILILSVAWLTIIICMFVAIPNHSWLWLVSCFSTLQAVMNFQRKSTIGFSIGNILLDLVGGLANYGQMAVQSIDQRMNLLF
ncbi:hypothetical protein L2E82_21426 [Cichorium intybus]|uniref:Uncharacterized protein n=1 Tax=Cichorium intybus TaxID=13427 RepID=A0ACB9DWR4_CICIN|nr:hypothetical protein L2E82_21426 [Cichorium intybus]